MTDDTIPYALDLIRNPQARAEWERRHPELAEKMRQRVPLVESDKQEKTNDDT